MPYFGFFKTHIKRIQKLSDFTVEQRQRAQSLYFEALANDERHDDKNAIDQYTAALEIVPIFWEALDNRGLCYMRLGDFASAIGSFETSTQISPDSPLALVALIKCYRETHQNVNAMHVADYFAKKWPGESPFPNWDTILRSVA